MLEISELIARARLTAIGERVNDSILVRELTSGVYEPQPGDFIPPFPTDPELYAAAQQAWKRVSQQVATIAPEALRTLVDATVGSTNWGGTGSALDEAITTENMERFCRGWASDWYNDGIMAGYAYESRDTGEVSLTALGGYLEPIYNQFTLNKIDGLMQIESYWGTTAKGVVKRWLTRFYDWSEQKNDTDPIRMVEYRDMDSPVLLSTGIKTEDLKFPPVRWRIAQTTPEGFPIGSMMQAAKLFLGLFATEYRLARVEEYAAHPVPVFEDGEISTVSPGHPVKGRFQFAQPGSLEELRKQRAIKLDGIRSFLRLPTALAGSDMPSGEALAQLNQGFYQVTSTVAQALSGIISQLIADFANLANLPIPDGFKFAVIPNRDYVRKQVMTDIPVLHEKGIIPLGVAAREIQPFLPTWTDEELQQWIDEQSKPLTPDQLRQSLQQTAPNAQPEQPPIQG